MRKPSHFDICIDENCERKWCVDRRNADCLKKKDCLVKKDNGKVGRCVYCHTKYVCSGEAECELHGSCGP